MGGSWCRCTAEDQEITVGITRAHLEEDTARLLHGGRDHSLVDFNRAGVPLMEIVTEPDLRSPAQARAYGETLRDVLRFIGASDARHGGRFHADRGQRQRATDRERGLRHQGRGQEPQLVPIARAGDGVRGRAHDRGPGATATPITQETRGWDETGGRTIPQRAQGGGERLPLLPRARPAAAATVPRSGSKRSARALPELPAARRARYVTDLGLSAYDAGVLTADVSLGDYFDAVVGAGVPAKAAANWVAGEFSRLLNQHAAEGLRARDVALPPEGLAELIAEVEAGRVSPNAGKQVLARCFESGETPRVVILAEGLAGRAGRGRHRRGGGCRPPREAAAVADYRSGKQQVYGFLVGQVMQRLGGKGDARAVNEELRRRLDTDG